VQFACDGGDGTGTHDEDNLSKSRHPDPLSCGLVNRTKVKSLCLTKQHVMKTSYA
jgi:hypothetical protein